jgi:alkylhydroperoxidase family enzyme
MALSRIPFPDLTDLPETATVALRSIPVQLNVFRMAAHAPDLLPPLIDLGHAILGKQRLNPRLREAAVLRLASKRSIAYEWVQHEPMARAAGLTDEEIELIRLGRITEPLLRSVTDLTDALLEDATCTAEQLATLGRLLSHQEITELIITIGYYLTIGHLMNALDIDIDPAGEELVRGAPHWYEQIDRSPAPRPLE